MSGIAREKMGNATSIYNLMRNIGGSFGIATMTTFLARRGQVHQNQLIVACHALRSRDADDLPRHASLVPGCTARTQWKPRAKRWARSTAWCSSRRRCCRLSRPSGSWASSSSACCRCCFLLRNARDLHPHEKKPGAANENGKRSEPAAAEPELLGAYH